MEQVQLILEKISSCKGWVMLEGRFKRGGFPIAFAMQFPLDKNLTSPTT